MLSKYRWQDTHSRTPGCFRFAESLFDMLWRRDASRISWMHYTKTSVGLFAQLPHPLKNYLQADIKHSVVVQWLFGENYRSLPTLNFAACFCQAWTACALPSWKQCRRKLFKSSMSSFALHIYAMFTLLSVISMMKPDSGPTSNGHRRLRAVVAETWRCQFRGWRWAFERWSLGSTIVIQIFVWLLLIGKVGSYWSSSSLPTRFLLPGSPINAHQITRFRPHLLADLTRSQQQRLTQRLTLQWAVIASDQMNLWRSVSLHSM